MTDDKAFRSVAAPQDDKASRSVAARQDDKGYRSVAARQDAKEYRSVAARQDDKAYRRVPARQDAKAYRSVAARQDAAVRAAGPNLSMGYVIHELSPTGVTLRKRGSGPTLPGALLAPALYWIMRPFRRPARYVVLTTDDNGVVTTTYR